MDGEVNRPNRRIALVGPAYPYRGGIAHFSNRFARELARRHEVLMLTFSRQYPDLLFPGDTQMEEGMEAADWDLPVRPVRMIDSINPLTWWRAGRWLGRQDPDTVVFAYWMPFFVPAYRGVLAGLRSGATGRTCEVLWLHNLTPHERLPGARLLVHRLVRQMDRLVSLSDSIREEVGELRPDATVMSGFHPVYDIFEEPVDPVEARRDLGIDEELPTVLFFGYVRRYKGLDVLLDALAHLSEETPVQVLVAGAFYEDESEYRRQADRLGLTGGSPPRVRFVPEYVPTEEVHLYFSAADLVVQPYRSATQSGVARTAFYFERPVVVTDVGGLAEEVPDGEAGYVVPPEDPEALAGAIERFFDGDPERFREGVRRQARKFSWRALTERFTEFVSDCPDSD